MQKEQRVLMPWSFMVVRIVYLIYVVMVLTYPRVCSSCIAALPCSNKRRPTRCSTIAAAQVLMFTHDTTHRMYDQLPVTHVREKSLLRPTTPPAVMKKLANYRIM